MGGAKTKRVRSQPVEAPLGESPLSLLLTGVVGLLLMLRFLVPAESAEEGMTLWIVQFWLAAGLIWAWNALRERDDTIRWSRLDVAMWVVVAGHVVSCAAILIGGGQKRAALNLTWEWVGLGVCFFLMRQRIHNGVVARRLIAMVVVVGVVLAGLGLWQHYVYYPSIRQEYDQKKTELESLQSAARTGPRDDAFQRVQQQRELQAWMLDAGVPQDPTARQLFEERLNSSEPFGMFALANTFGGLLLVALILACGTILAAWQRRPEWKTLILPLATVGLLAFCLILTKSRTAWVGLAAGCAVWGTSRFWSGAGRNAKWLPYAAAGGGLLLMLLAVAAISGGLDAEVVTEAPKSLSYRMQYWSGAWKVIGQHPLLGAGPGNFRHQYLHFKLPASSEEIADPHNFVLDVWANGGLLALVGLCVFLYLTFRLVRQSASDSPPSDGNSVSRVWHPLTIGGGLAFPALFLLVFLAGQGLDFRLPVMLAGFLIAAAVWWKVSNSPGPSGVCLVAAVAGLATHLLGAGGIEMPGIVQLLLMLAVCLAVWGRAESFDEEAEYKLPRRALLVGGGLGVLFVCCLLSATAPVLNRRALVASGDAAIAGGNGATSAIRFYGEAAARDPFSPEPLRRLADLYLARWAALPGDNSGDFDRGIEFLNLASEREPDSPGNFHALGRWYLARHERNDRQEDVAAAVAAMREAAARYPNSAEIRADLALALGAANDPAAAVEAASALKQDAINRREGHIDKLLNPQTIDRLHELSGNSPNEAAAETNRN